MLNLYRYIACALIVFTLTACGSAQPAEAATKAQSIQFLLSQVRASGVALSGGKVDFYEAGATTTRKTVWIDRNKATPAANPYTLDSNGTAQLYGDGLYRIVIKDSAGVTKYDRDYISIKEVAGNVYDVADYASLAAAVASIGSTPATLQFAADVTVSTNLVIPSTLELIPLNGAKINHTTYTISYAGSTARWPLAQMFNGSGAVTLSASGVNYPEWFGAKGDDSTDNTAAYSKLITAAPEFSTIKFSSGPYIGNFISSKSFNLDLNNQTVKPSPTTPTVPAIQFIGTSELITTLSANTAYGQRSITVTSGAGISADDLLLLVDDKVRPSDSTPAINAELIRVESVNVNTVTVRDMIRSIQDTGTLNVYKITPVVKPSVKNVKVDMGGSNSAPAVYFLYCLEPHSENVAVTQHLGHALRHEACYGATGSNAYPTAPAGTGSGEGYGVVFKDCRLARFSGIFALGARHPLDISSSYDIQVENINDPQGGVEGSVILAHNTFGGLISVEKVIITTDNYAVNWSAQGVTTAANYIARDIKIKDVVRTIPTKKTDQTDVSVYIQTAFANLIIDNVTARYLDITATPSVASSVVRLNGMSNGSGIVTNINANEAGVIVSNNVATTSAPNTSDNLIIKSISASRVFNAAYLAGGRNYIIDDVTCPTVEGAAAISAVKSGTYNPEKLVIGNGISTDMTKPVISLTGYSTPSVRGSFPALRSTSNTDVTDGVTISAAVVQQNSGYLYLVTPTTAAITLGATGTLPAPVFVGQRLLVAIAPTRGDVKIPAASDRVYTPGADITLAKGKVYQLVGDGAGSKWFVEGI